MLTWVFMLRPFPVHFQRNCQRSFWGFHGGKIYVLVEFIQEFICWMLQSVTNVESQRKSINRWGRSLCFPRRIAYNGADSIIWQCFFLTDYMVPSYFEPFFIINVTKLENYCLVGGFGNLEWKYDLQGKQQLAWNRLLFLNTPIQILKKSNKEIFFFNKTTIWTPY